MKMNLTAKTIRIPWWFRFHWKSSCLIPLLFYYFTSTIFLIPQASSFIVIISDNDFYNYTANDEQIVLFDAKIILNYHKSNSNSNNNKFQETDNNNDNDREETAKTIFTGSAFPSMSNIHFTHHKHKNNNHHQQHTADATEDDENPHFNNKKHYSSLINDSFYYQYRVSHHKTHPWIHRLVQFDTSRSHQGKLRFRRNYSHSHQCQQQQQLGSVREGKFKNDKLAGLVAPVLPSAFLVYIDIIKSPVANKNTEDEEEYTYPIPSSSSSQPQTQFNNEINAFDYISFPLMIILQCNNNQKTDNSHHLQQLIRGQDTKQHWARSIDDIYVSLPVDSSFCHHKSEVIGNIYNFIPESIQSHCKIDGSITETNHFFAIEKSTMDIVLKSDFCLFQPFYTVEMLLKLECKNGKRNDKDHIIGWDQLVHFILHRVHGGSLLQTPIGSTNDISNNYVHSSNTEFTHPIHRIRREMRNKSPFFEHALYKASVLEEQPAGISVTTITANDPENSHLTYSMTSLLDARSQQYFSLDSKSGIISTLDKLDREKMDVHYFRLIASDSGIPPRTGTTTLEIQVEDINDHDPVFEKSSYSITIREGISVGSTVLSVRATDQDIDRNGDLSYIILNPHDIDDTFRIDSKTGVITTNLILDREQRDEYKIIIQANDMAFVPNERRSATTTVSVEIRDENDNYPQFSQKLYNVTIPENIDVSTYPVIARVSATDADEGVNSALRYSIIGGNSQNHFSIDSLTGEVSLLKALDYEATKSYRLNIRAIDNGNPSRSNNTQLVVNLQDINDNSPRFYSQIFQETLQENLPIGSSLVRIQAYDLDEGLNGKINYRISYREKPETFPFEIDQDSGWITTNKALDREVQSRYDFDVIAADSGDVPASATASVVLTVLDLNDNEPVFSPKLYETMVSEQEVPGTPVVTVKATDPDENSRLIYEITEGNIRNRFSISPQNGHGIIAIAQPLDFKLERKFVLTVKATDNGGKFDLATVYIDIVDANSHAPSFQGTPYSAKIFEDVPIGTTVFTVTASDDDSGQNAQIVYSFIPDLDNEGYEDFMIDSSTGAIVTMKSLDRERVSGYILTVNAKDKGIPPMSDTTDVELIINDVNDLNPIFLQEHYQAKVSEDVPVGTSILQVQASDGDQGKNSIVRYSFSTFSDGDGTFSVDSASGIIRTIKPLDRETVSRYDLMVLAIDHGTPELTGRTNITIHVTDVNDSPPHWESETIRLFIPENSPVGSKVGTIQAYDLDEGQNAQIIYSIVGGVDMKDFTLVTHPQQGGNGIGNGISTSADILTRVELDFESPRKKYDIIVRAASPPLRSDVHVQIQVQDENDNLPYIGLQDQNGNGKGSSSVHIILNNYKDYFPIGPIGRLPAFDADVTDKLQYSILNGNKANLIYLNESTGLITLSPYLDTNVPLMAKIEILVSDGLNEARGELILSTRMVTDELLFNSISIQLADMTTEAFLSPLYTQFVATVGMILNTPKENVIIFSVEEEIDVSHGLLNISFAARKPHSTSSTSSEEYFTPDYLRERVFLNRLMLSKLSHVEILPFHDDLCLLEPCPNFEDCLSVMRFRNVSNFIATDSVLFRSVLPWQTFACRCPSGFTGLKEHYLCDAEINLCFSSPCKNGGTCYRKESGFSCSCPAGFTGSQCEIHMSMDTCQPNICSKGSICTPRLRGGFICQNCSSRGDYVNSLCELTARSFSRGSYLTFPGLKNRFRFTIKLSFATQQRNGLLFYNGRYNEKFDFIALEIVNSTVRFSFSLGSANVSHVHTGKIVSDGLWHTVEVQYFNKTATVSIDDCDVILSLEHQDEFPKGKSCAGRATQVLESRCDLLIESCQRFLDLTGPLYFGGLPPPSTSLQIQTHDFVGCVKNIIVDHKFLDLNHYVVEYGTTAGCPEKKNFCLSQPCRNGGKCKEGWGTYRCTCADGFGQKDCSEDARPTWNLREENSYISFTPQLHPIQFPWYNSISLRTLASSGNILSILLNNNETIHLSLENNGLLHYTLDRNEIPITLPKVNDGLWHNIEVKWMTAEIWFSLDFGQHEITIQYEGKVQGLHVVQVIVGSNNMDGARNSIQSCVQDVRIGNSRNYLRKANTERNVGESCSLATACIGAVCPLKATCIEEAGRHKCKCDSGFVGVNCVGVCDLKPCKNHGTCSLDFVNNTRGYSCKCDDRFYRGTNCEETLDLSCPSTWWNWQSTCVPCSCSAEKNFSPDCNKKTGQCKCKEYHYEKDDRCIDCMCYSVGSVSKNCDLSTGKCQCRPSVIGNRCDSCSSPFGEVTTRGCEIITDGCPRNFASDIWWPRTKFVSTAVHECPSGAIGLATRDCFPPNGWAVPDVFNCTSTTFISILNVLGQLDSEDLKLTPLLSTKLAGDLFKALNTSQRLYGNDIWSSLRLLTHLIRYEVGQKGLYLSHRQDRNFIRNLALSAGKITSKEYAPEWNRIIDLYNPAGGGTILKIMEKYLIHLTLNQEDTFTKPFEVITQNLVLGLDTVELTWENRDRKNFEDLEIESTFDVYETNTLVKRAVKFPKYDNIIMDPKRYTSSAKVLIPLDLLGLNEDKEMAGNAVVGYLEYYSIWNILPKRFKNDVDRRFNSDLIAYPPIITLSVLASRLGLQKGRQSSPIRITYEIIGYYIDSSNPQCVIWEEADHHHVTSNPDEPVVLLSSSESGLGYWTTRPCTTELEENYSASHMANIITVNCTCWHLSTFAVLIENNDSQDIPRPTLIEDVVSYVAFSLALVLILGALIALGLLKGPVPATLTNTIHKHLLLCIFGSLLFYFLGLKLRLYLVQNDILCRVLAIGLHFLWLSTFAWLFTSALHLRRIFIEVRDVNHGSAMVYFAFGYAFPILCVLLSLGVRANHYGNNFFCWLSLYEGIVWGMVGPILFCVIVTLIYFMLAIHAAFSLKDHVVDSGNMRTLLWMDLTLLPICGMVWTLCLLGANERSSFWQYSISGSVLLLSLYIALGYCILNQRVKDSLYIRAGNLFRPHEESQQQNVSRSALAYRSDTGLRAEDLRHDILFRGARSMGISTASTTSRSTTKTSSSPYREGFHTYGGTPSLDKSRLARAGDTIDVMGNGYHKRRKGSNSDEEGSSDGEHTLELASSHSSDEDEAMSRHGPIRTEKIDARSNIGNGGPGSGNSGSDNENPNSLAAPQEYVPQKVLNSTENIQLGYSHDEKLSYQEPVNDLNGTLGVVYVPQLQMSPHLRGNPPHPLSTFSSHISSSSTPHPQMLSYHHHTFQRAQDSPISPVQEEIPTDDILPPPEYETEMPNDGGGIVNLSLQPEDEVNPEFRDEGENESEIYGGSITSGVLV